MVGFLFLWIGGGALAYFVASLYYHQEAAEHALALWLILSPIAMIFLGL